MRQRSLDEMITYFNQEIDKMDIDRRYKIALLGMVTAIGCTAKQTIEERKKGKWIRLDKDNKFFVPHMLQCSECGNILDKHGVNAGRGDANYCPNCGADMKGENNGE